MFVNGVCGIAHLCVHRLALIPNLSFQSAPAKTVLSQYAQHKYPFSSADAAVYDIAVGNMDLYVGPMWMLVKRTSLCDFLPTIGSDYLYFYAPRQPGSCLSDLSSHLKGGSGERLEASSFSQR